MDSPSGSRLPLRGAARGVESGGGSGGRSGIDEGSGGGGRPRGGSGAQPVPLRSRHRPSPGADAATDADDVVEDVETGSVPAGLSSRRGRHGGGAAGASVGGPLGAGAARLGFAGDLAASSSGAHAAQHLASAQPAPKIWPALRHSSLSTRRLGEEDGPAPLSSQGVGSWWFPPGMLGFRGGATPEVGAGEDDAGASPLARGTAASSQGPAFIDTEAARSGHHWVSVASFGEGDRAVGAAGRDAHAAHAALAAHGTRGATAGVVGSSPSRGGLISPVSPGGAGGRPPVGRRSARSSGLAPPSALSSSLSGASSQDQTLLGSPRRSQEPGRMPAAWRVPPRGAGVGAGPGAGTIAAPSHAPESLAGSVSGSIAGSGALPGTSLAEQQFLFSQSLSTPRQSGPVRASRGGLVSHPSSGGLQPSLRDGTSTGAAASPRPAPVRTSGPQAPSPTSPSPSSLASPFSDGYGSGGAAARASAGSGSGSGPGSARSGAESRTPTSRGSGGSRVGGLLSALGSLRRRGGEQGATAGAAGTASSPTSAAAADGAAAGSLRGSHGSPSPSPPPGALTGSTVVTGSVRRSVLGAASVPRSSPMVGSFEAFSPRASITMSGRWLSGRADLPQRPAPSGGAGRQGDRGRGRRGLDREASDASLGEPLLDEDAAERGLQGPAGGDEDDEDVQGLAGMDLDGDDDLGGGGVGRAHGSGQAQGHVQAQTPASLHGQGVAKVPSPRAPAAGRETARPAALGVSRPVAFGAFAAGGRYAGSDGSSPTKERLLASGNASEDDDDAVAGANADADADAGADVGADAGADADADAGAGASRRARGEGGASSSASWGQSEEELANIRGTRTLEGPSGAQDELFNGLPYAEGELSDRSFLEALDRGADAQLQEQVALAGAAKAPAHAAVSAPPAAPAPHDSAATSGLALAIVTGLINALLALPVMVSYTAIIYRDPLFAPRLGELAKVTFLCSAVHQCMFSAVSTLPFAVGQVQDVGLIFLSAMASSIADQCARAGVPDADALATTLLTLTVSTLLVGICTIFVGTFRLARLVQYVPVPVIGGYLAFVGYFCVAAGAGLASDVPIEAIADWAKLLEREPLTRLLPAILAAYAIFAVQRRCQSPFALPATLFAIPLFFFAVLYATGHNIDEARSTGWITPAQASSNEWRFWKAWAILYGAEGDATGAARAPVADVGAEMGGSFATQAAHALGQGFRGLQGARNSTLWPPSPASSPLFSGDGSSSFRFLSSVLQTSSLAPLFDSSVFASLRVYASTLSSRILWSAMPSQLGKLVALFFVVAFGSSLDVAAIQSGTPLPLDYNAELVTVGVSNVAAGLTGFGATGSYIFSQTLFTMRSGVTSPANGIVIVLAELAVFALPLDVVSFVPKLLFGALVMWIGQDIFKDWAIIAAKRLSLAEYLLLVGTFFAILALGLEAGVAVGILGCAAWFSVAYARVTLAPFHVLPSRSGAVRAYGDRAVLEALSDRICACRLTGYIFFGSALSACDAVAELAGEMSRRAALTTAELVRDAARAGEPAAARLAATLEGSDAATRAAVAARLAEAAAAAAVGFGPDAPAEPAPDGAPQAPAGVHLPANALVPARRYVHTLAAEEETVRARNELCENGRGSRTSAGSGSATADSSAHGSSAARTALGAQALPLALSVTSPAMALPDDLSLLDPPALRAARATAPLFFLLDFSRVRGLDATAARSFVTLHARLLRLGVRLIVTHLPPAHPSVRHILVSQGLLLKESGDDDASGSRLATPEVPGDGCTWFRTLDGALQACEEALLDAARRTGAAQPRRAAMSLDQVLLAHEDGPNGVAIFLPPDRVPEAARRLDRYASAVEVAAGEVLFEKGALPEEFFIIRSGRILVSVGYAGDAIENATEAQLERSFHYEPGGIVGELDFFLDRPRSFSARASSPGELYSFSRQAIKTMAVEDPELLLVLQAIVLRSACLTVAHTAEAIDRGEAL